MTGGAVRAELAAVDVGVTGGTLSLRAPEVDDAAGRGHGGLGRGGLVAGRARDRCVLAVEDELRACRVVELRWLESGFRVAGRTVLRGEEALVRVLVAVRAARVLQPDEVCRLHVAGLAGDGRVFAAERVARLRVVELLAFDHRLEARGDVARRADTERRLVRVLVAVLAGREARDPVLALDLVAALARRLQMRAGERVLCPRVVEALAGLLECDVRRVAGQTGRAERPVVDVLVAGRARRREAEVRARLVAGLAVERGVKTVEDEAGLALVVEALRLEVPEVAVRPRVLDVAAGALVARRAAVDALLRLDPLGDGLVALEALGRGHLPARLVAVLTLVQALELRVRLRELAG